MIRTYVLLELWASQRQRTDAAVRRLALCFVDANLYQHTRALERASCKGTEEQQGHTDRLDRLSKPVRPVSRVSLESVVSRDKYHTYVVKSGKVYEQTSKG